jgi:homoserine dehydrogenase
MSQPFRIGIAGLGTVGTGVIKVIQKNGDLLALRAGRPIEIVCVTAQSKSKKRGVDIGGYRWIDDIPAMADVDGLDAIVEVIGGSDGPAKALIEKALKKGIHVVTANKALLAHHGQQLSQMAEDSGAGLAYEAAVAGCIPIIKAVRESFTANRISAVYGILNGTCNYILTTMRETGCAFGDVLSEAQAKGYAEADPSFDIEGIDAGHKLSLLAANAFGTVPNFGAVEMTGIKDIQPIDIAFAGELGFKIKLLGIAKFDGKQLVQTVEPCLVPGQSPLGSIEDVYNAVFVEGDFFETPLLTGRGAGEGPTASAVVADIIDLARGHKIPAFGIPAARLKVPEYIDSSNIVARYYLRLSVLDEPGVIADLSAILRDLNISIESMIQRGRDPGQPVPVVLMTHKARFADIQEACARIDKLRTSIEPPRAIRVEQDL